MKIKIFTEKYMDIFMDWIEDNNYGNRLEDLEITGAGGFVALDIAEAMTWEIALLFENIIICKAGMASANKGLKSFLQNAVFRRSEENICEIFESFIAENDYVNLEGFVTFRLEEYSARVNMALYAAVKRILY